MKRAAKKARGTRKLQQRKATGARKATVTVGFDSELDEDWTPPEDRIWPRVVTEKQGNVSVEIEESRYADNSLGLYVGASIEDHGKDRHNVIAESFEPSELDVLISLLQRACAKARELEMPSDRGNKHIVGGAR